MRHCLKALSPKHMSSHSALQLGKWGLADWFFSLHVLESSFRVMQGPGPSPFPCPRASAPICCCVGSGLSMRRREDICPPPCGSCKPHTLTPLPRCHPLPRYPAARLRIPLLGVSQLLFLRAVSQSPSRKGMQSFNF